MHSVSPALDVGITSGKKFPPADGWHECGQRSNKTIHGVFLHTTEAPPATKISYTTFGALIAGCATALLPPTGQAKTPRQEALACRCARWWRSLFKEGKLQHKCSICKEKPFKCEGAIVTTQLPFTSQGYVFSGRPRHGGQSLKSEVIMRSILQQQAREFSNWFPCEKKERRRCHQTVLKW